MQKHELTSATRQPLPSGLGKLKECVEQVWVEERQVSEPRCFEARQGTEKSLTQGPGVKLGLQKGRKGKIKRTLAGQKEGKGTRHGSFPL